MPGSRTEFSNAVNSLFAFSEDGGDLSTETGMQGDFSRQQDLFFFEAPFNM
jgi:hypothetical protein